MRDIESTPGSTHSIVAVRMPVQLRQQLEDAARRDSLSLAAKVRLIIAGALREPEHRRAG